MSVSVTYYIGSHGQNGQLFIGARDGHVLFVSGYPILTAVNSFKMDGVYSNIFDIGLHVGVRTDGRAYGARNVLTKFSCIHRFPISPRAEAPLLS